MQRGDFGGDSGSVAICTRKRERVKGGGGGGFCETLDSTQTQYSCTLQYITFPTLKRVEEKNHSRIVFWQEQSISQLPIVTPV